MFSGTRLDRGGSGDKVDCENSEKMKTDVRARARRCSGCDHQEAGGRSKSTAKNMLEWGPAVKIGDIGCLVFGSGVRRCDST